MKNLKRIAALLLIVCMLPVIYVSAAADMQVVFHNDANRNAGGIITVTADTDDKVWFWWGSGNEKLADHTYLGYCSVVSGIGTFEIQRYTYIPEGATQILAFSDTDGELVASYTLPDYKIQSIGNKAYSFGAVSDAHVGHSTYPNSEADFDRAYNKFGEYGVSLIANDGDVSSYNLINDWGLYCTKVNNFNEKYPYIPCFAVTGNHDASHNDFDVTNWNKYTKDDIVNYKGKGQPEFYDGNTLDYLYRIENDVFIFLNATDWKDTSHTIDYYDHEQLEWLERRLEENKDKRIFFFMHYGPYDSHPRYTSTGAYYGGGCFEDGDYMDTRFTEIYAKYPNVMAFFGHTHKGFNWQLGQYVQGTTYSDTTGANLHNIEGGATYVHIPSLTEPTYYYYDESTGAPASSSDANHLSEAYMVDVYDDCVVLRGYDFMTDEFIAYANYIVDLAGSYNSIEVDDKLLLDNTNKTVTVKGTSAEDAGKEAVMLLTYQETDPDTITNADILYYDQQTVNPDGSYSFSFQLPASVTADAYQVIVNIGGKDRTATVTETKLDASWLDAGIEIEENPGEEVKAIYTLKNYSEEEIDCRIILAIYNADGTLMDTDIRTLPLAAGMDSDRIAVILPKDAAAVTAFVWSTDNQILPLCSSKRIER